MPIELRGVRWQHKEANAVFGTGLFETGLEFAAAVDLKGSHREGHVLQQPVQEAPGIVGRGAAIGPHHIPSKRPYPGP